MSTTFPPALRHFELICKDEHVVRLAFATTPVIPDTPVAKKLTALLTRYFAGERVDFSAVPVAIVRGTAFQRRVWQAMCTIPYGEVCTYAGLAARSGHPRAVRAVGNAAAANPVVVVIPCHRIVRSDGTVGNYGGGQVRKRQLLALERCGEEALAVLTPSS